MSKITILSIGAFILMVVGFLNFYPIAQDEMSCSPKFNLPMANQKSLDALNVYGKKLISCCTDPMTGFYRNGFCLTGRTDYGTHVACAVVTQEFLNFSAKQGNDLITPRLEFHFPGLKAGDKWCLCISRWIEALNHGVAPPLDLNATHSNALNYVSLDILEIYSIGRQN